MKNQIQDAITPANDVRFSCRLWYSQVENSFHSKAEPANYANVMG
jgi:hypothetical protein